MLGSAKRSLPPAYEPAYWRRNCCGGSAQSFIPASLSGNSWWERLLGHQHTICGSPITRLFRSRLSQEIGRARVTGSGSTPVPRWIRIGSMETYLSSSNTSVLHLRLHRAGIWKQELLYWKEKWQH